MLQRGLRLRVRGAATVVTLLLAVAGAKSALAAEPPAAGAPAGEGSAAGAKGPVVLVDKTPAPAAQGHGRILAVGVAAFDDPAWPALQFAERDAEDLAAALATEGSFTTTVLTGGEATRAGVLEALAALEREARGKDDTLVVYLSTHGTLARDLDGSLKQVVALRDTRRDDPLATGLRLDELIARFEHLASRRKALILATCYSGAGKSSLGDSVRTYLAGVKGPALRPLYEVSAASAVLSASAWGEAAREDPTLGHDIYTHFFIEALHGFDPNGDGATTVSEAHDFASRETYRFSAGAQRPTAILSVEGEDPMVLVGERTRRGKPVLVAYDESLNGLEVRVDGAAKGALPGGIVVDAGWHDLELARPNGEVVLADRVRLEEGERVSVARLMAAEPPRQVEVRVGALFLPGTEHGATVNVLGAVGLGVRLAGWPSSAVDLGVELGAGAGRDTWEVNAERVAVALTELSGRVIVSKAWEAGRLKVAAGVEGGVVWVERRPDSPYFKEPRRSLSAAAGLAGLARLRLSRQWAIGLAAHGDYLVGGLQGLVGQVSLGATWSF